MDPVSVGGFDDKIIGCIHMLRIFDDRLVQIAYISGKYNLFRHAILIDPDLNTG